MKVKATAEYEKRGMKAVEIGRIPKEGEIFETTKEKFKVLNGNNKYNAIFVESVKEEKENSKKNNNTDFDILNTKSNVEQEVKNENKDDLDIFTPKKRNREYR